MPDFRFAFRQLSKSPGFTAVAILTLALGISATTALFSVVYGVIISPYPYAHPETIWAPGLRTEHDEQILRPYRRDEFDAMAGLSAFSEVMGTSPGRMLLTGEYAPEEVTVPRLTAGAFQFLGVAPILGRTFGPGDFPSNGQPEPVAVLSYQLWQRLLAGSPQALGRTLRLDDQIYTIIGVMPPRFGWWTSDGLWLPRSSAPGDLGGIFPIARLKPGISLESAREQLDGLQQELGRINPSGFPKSAFKTTLTNYLDITAASGEMQRTLTLLFAVAGFLLLIACSNIANLQLARGSFRTREMAIRLSLGAPRGRLIRQLLAESVLLSGLGGFLGLVLAVAITRLMVLLMPSFYVPNEARITVNGWVLLFCLAVSVATGIVFGLVPALQSTRPNLTDALKSGGKGSVSDPGRRFRSGLVVTEVALSVVLLVGAGLTVRSFLALQRVDLGFQPEQVVAVDVTLPPARYATYTSRARLAEELIDRVQHLPDVEAVSFGNGGVPFGGPTSPYSIHGQAGAESQPLTLNLVGSGHLKAMGIALRRGRMLEPDDVRRGDPVVVINEAAAKLWPAGEDPIGTQFQVDLFGKAGGSLLLPPNASSNVTVVGICADTRNNGLASTTLPTVYAPYSLVAPLGRTLAIRTRGNPSTILDAVRAELRAIDPLLPIRNTRTLEQALVDQTVQPRFTMTLFSLFAAVGLALAAAGLFSVLSYLVTRRTREIGVRMALGAQRSDVLKLALKDGGRLAGLGLAIGVVVGLGAARYLGSQIDLYQVSPTDPVSFIGVVLSLGFVAFLASWFPARRAASVNPVEALRSE